MNNDRRVLIYGVDSELLQIRRLILEKVGIHLQTTTELREPTCEELHLAVDLLILCHTLTMEQSGRAVALAAKLWPHAKCLLLTAGVPERAPSCTAEVLDSWDGPCAFLGCVSRLLSASSRCL